MKRRQKIWAGNPPPLIWTISKKTAVFLQETSPSYLLLPYENPPLISVFCLFKIIHKPRTMLRLGVHFNHALIIHDYYSSFRGFYLLVDIVNCSEISTNICLFVDSVLFIAQSVFVCLFIQDYSVTSSNVVAWRPRHWRYSIKPQAINSCIKPLKMNQNQNQFWLKINQNQFLHQTPQNEGK